MSIYDCLSFLNSLLCLHPFLRQGTSVKVFALVLKGHFLSSWIFKKVLSKGFEGVNINTLFLWIGSCFHMFHLQWLLVHNCWHVQPCAGRILFWRDTIFLVHQGSSQRTFYWKNAPVLEGSIPPVLENRNQPGQTDPPAVQGDPEQAQTLCLTLFGPSLVLNLDRTRGCSQHPSMHTAGNKSFGSQPYLTQIKWELTNCNYYRV